MTSSTTESHRWAEASDRSLVGAVAEVVSAGQRVIVDRLEIGFLELRAALDASVNAAVLMLLAVVLFATAWLALNGGLLLLLADRLSRPVGLLVVAAANALVALVLVGAALRLRLRAPAPPKTDGDVP